jgi:hypothetical protein|tara:strand:- start:313 stop:537 length:225 start_codon:yes stop_codon:yes gene_type:complete
MSDQINSPAHYTKGRVEAIDVIEDVVAGAPDAVTGYLVGQTLKYLLRAWHKGNTMQDLQKAAWYLNRAIDRFNP